ncbi:MAG: YccF domain-containing protein [Acholeplasmatales bacterium]|nr:YccF domain-containing protein [Acholeplasmatales bacterium]
MRTIGNIIWFIFIGLWSAIGFVLGGVIFCITIIGIPFGLQLFKLAKLVILPFGKEPEIHFEKHIFANIIWLILGGIGNFLGYMFVGIIFCITIIGIPFGKQCFKLAKLAAVPFGAEV